MMTTVVLGVLDPATGRLRYTNAGHPPPLLVGADGAAGYLEDARRRRWASWRRRGTGSTRSMLEPGSTLVLYTDGLVEQPTEVLDVGLERLRGGGRRGRGR